MLALALFSGITIALILATLFTSLTEMPLDIRAAARAPLGTPEFRAAVESVTLASAKPLDSQIEMFTDGNLFLTDLLEEIEAAEHSVTITNYIFKEGRMANEIIGALAAKAGQGVAVRLLMDAAGGIKAPEEKLEKLKAAGGRVAIFRPFSFRALTRIHRRTHVRAIVIDGKVGYTGGLAFQDEWFGDGKTEEGWRDLMFKYEGALARATQDHFNALWRQTDGEILTGPEFYPDQLEAEAQKNSYFVSLFHSPAPDLSADLLDLIWLSITGAQSHIYLATPYLTPNAEIIEAIKQAVERGVRVEILVPGPHTDNRPVQAATRAHYKTLLEAGAHIYEYQPGRFHEKFLVADGHWSLIGSANMDNRSATLNVENVFGIENEALARLLEEEFDHGRSASEERTLENFNPNLFKRAYYNILALFAKQF